MRREGQRLRAAVLRAPGEIVGHEFSGTVVEAGACVTANAHWRLLETKLEAHGTRKEYL